MIGSHPSGEATVNPNISGPLRGSATSSGPLLPASAEIVEEDESERISGHREDSLDHMAMPQGANVQKEAAMRESAIRAGLSFHGHETGSKRGKKPYIHDDIIEWTEFDTAHQDALNQCKQCNWEPLIAMQKKGGCFTQLMRSPGGCASILNYAIVQKRRDIMKMLLGWNFSETTVSLAAYHLVNTPEGYDDPVMLKLLIDYGKFNVDHVPGLVSPVVQQANPSNRSYLSCLALKGKVNLMRVVLATPVQEGGSSRTGNKDVDCSIVVTYDKLGDSKEVINNRQVEMGNALLSAIVAGHLDAIDLLLERNTDPNVSTEMYGTYWNATTFACENIATIACPDGKATIEILVRLLHTGKPKKETVEETLKHTKKRKYILEGRSMLPQWYLERYLNGDWFCCDVCEAVKGVDGGKLKMCKCRKVAYCGRECQVKAWASHKLVCGKK